MQKRVVRCEDVDALLGTAGLESICAVTPCRGVKVTIIIDEKGNATIEDIEKLAGTSSQQSTTKEPEKKP